VHEAITPYRELDQTCRKAGSWLVSERGRIQMAMREKRYGEYCRRSERRRREERSRTRRREWRRMEMAE